MSSPEMFSRRARQRGRPQPGEKRQRDHHAIPVDGERTEMKRNRMHGGKLKRARRKWKFEIRRSVVSSWPRAGGNSGRRRAARGGMRGSGGGSGGQSGTLRHQIAPGLAFLRATFATSVRRFSEIPRCSAALMLANFAKLRTHWRRCCGGNLSNDCRVFSICARSASDKRVERLLFFRPA